MLAEAEDTSNVILVERKHNIPSTTIDTWINKMKGKNSVSSRGPKSSSFNSINYNKEIEKENDKLKKLLGEKDL